MLVTLILFASGQSVFPSDYEDFSYRLDDSNLTKRDDSWNAMERDRSNTMWSRTLPNQAERSVSFDGQQLEVIYRGSCFSKENLASIRTFETSLAEQEAYKSKICALEGFNSSTVKFGASTSGVADNDFAPSNVSTCRNMTSIQRLFDGTFELALNETTGLPFKDDDGQNTFRPDPSFDRINKIVTTAFAATGKFCKATPGSTIVCPAPKVEGSDLAMLIQYAVGTGT